MIHSVPVLLSPLKVGDFMTEWRIDLPELTSIQLGSRAFSFQKKNVSTLIMRSGYDETKWGIDLPNLTSLTTITPSITFRDVRQVTIESTYASYHLPLDLPALTNVVLDGQNAFMNKTTLSVKGSPPPILPSHLDIGALQPYLNSSLSFTHKLLICNALFPVFKTIFISLLQSNTPTTYHNWTPFSIQFPCSP